ncbi:MAG: hypothetical protein PVSMB1_04960 [Gemmatimonadaceae bacterium]
MSDEVKYRPLSEQGMGRMITALFGGGETQFLPLVGRKLIGVSVSKDKNVLVFQFADGGEVKYNADGDCCSSSWIEHIEVPNDIAGAEVISVSEAPVIDATDDDTKNPRGVEKYEWEDEPRREHECLQVYQTVFGTTKGEIAVEYRNSSNGYYGGSLELEPLPCPKCGEQIGKWDLREHLKCFGGEAE